jgi:pre-mRNA-processing factor SLU7
MKKAELFAWEAHRATGEADIHLQANPTQTALLQKQASARQAAVTSLLEQRILSAYGDSAGGGAGGSSSSSGCSSSSSSSSSSSIALPQELRLGVTEAYIEYGADGRPLAEVAAEEAAKAAAAEAAARRYIAPLAASVKSTLHGSEDVHPGNHTSIWGSWFNTRTMQWGYQCCFSNIKGSFCTGEVGRRSFLQSVGGGGGGGASSSSSAAAEAAAGGGKKRSRGDPA